jgi:hypothetical protein
MDARLLRLLDAVLDEVHLARAAARVGWPLPAAASALERCRQLLRDPLLEDGGTQMRLTAAQALRETVRQRPWRPAASQQQVIAGPVARSACASSCRTIRRRWWRMRCIRNWPPAPTGPGIPDLAGRRRCRRPPGARRDRPGAGGRADQQVRGREVLQERCVVSCGAIIRPPIQLTLARWLAYPHLQIACHDSLNRMIDEQVAMQGLRRRIGMVIPNFLMAPALLQART